jgi:hypothetical protein
LSANKITIGFRVVPVSKNISSYLKNTNHEKESKKIVAEKINGENAHIQGAVI